ncbi:MAG: hypothetical protein WCG04_05825 [Alphaproteobacteria bacterium]
MDDNNVDVEVPWGFGKKVENTLGNSTNLQIKIFRRGSPMEAEEPINKGHSMPTKENFEAYMDTLINLLGNNAVL